MRPTTPIEAPASVPRPDDAAVLADIMKWDVQSWARALPFWKGRLRAVDDARALVIGDPEGGLSLWLAREGCLVTCTNLVACPPDTIAMHARYGVADRISYATADVTALDFPDEGFDIVAFKSVIGALGSKGRQLEAMREIHRVLRPRGTLLFAENLSGSRVHQWLRRRFIPWNAGWRYLRLDGDRDLFAVFAQVDLEPYGLLALLGRTERQRAVLATVDRFACPIAPRRWRYILFGVCVKDSSPAPANRQALGGRSTPGVAT